MRLQTAPVVAATNWRRELAGAVRDPDELCDLLGLDDATRASARAAARDFALLVPRGFLAKMKLGDPHDPLLRQVLPTADELTPVPGFDDDPLHEIGATQPTLGMLRKYAGRALLILAHGCAVNCRYCFRRHFPYDDAPLKLSDWRPALDAIAMNETLDEVILSGGDPLLRTDDWLAEFAVELADIPHLARLRIHTRVPVVIPSRVCDELLDWLTASRLAPYVVIHANHPAEFDDEVAAACGRLIDAGVVVLCQSVLLKGVNDDVETLAELCRRLANARVQPYYLHQLDRVAGAAHFETAEAAGAELIRQLEARLPGYAIPKYVREVPGALGKTPILERRP